MTEKSDFGPAKPEGRRQTRPVEDFFVIGLYIRIYTKEVFFSYRFLGTITQVTATWDIKRWLSSYISKRHT